VVSWAPERKGLARPLKRLALRRPILASWAAWGAGRALFRRGTLSRMGGPSFFSAARSAPSRRLLRPSGRMCLFVLIMPARLPPREPQGTSGAVLEHLRRAAAKKDPPRLARSTMEQRSWWRRL